MITLDTFLIATAILLGLAALLFWGSMAVHCYKNRVLPRENRVLWFVFILFGKLLGAGAYYYFKVRQRQVAAS